MTELSGLSVQSPASGQASPGSARATVQRALLETPRFHDGCWMYIRAADVTTSQQDVLDIEQLILIKKKPPRKRPPTIASARSMLKGMNTEDIHE